MSSSPIERPDTLRAEELSVRDFQRLSRFLHERTGIYMPESKKLLLEGRIHKRMRHLEIDAISSYCDYVLSPSGMEQELEFFINSVTTNKTDFMREFHHFEFLRNEGLPQLLKHHRPLSFWSAACSRGAEPYTLAMVLEDYLFKFPLCDLKYSIDASDISTEVLRYALRAIYPEEEMEPIPMEWKKRYLLRSRQPGHNQVRIHPKVRSKVQFSYINLMDAFPWNQLFDVIFCRNVTIYFDAQTRQELVHRLLDTLRPHGYLIMGHSETLDIARYPIIAKGPSIYQKL